MCQAKKIFFIKHIIYTKRVFQTECIKQLLAIGLE